MGFWNKLHDIVLDILTQQCNGMERKLEKVQYYKEKYSDYDDASLVEEYKRSSDEKRVAIGSVLKERGYVGKE